MPKKKKAGKKAEPKVGGIVGLGLDAEDGHARITRTPEMLLVGGESHKVGQGGRTEPRYQRLVDWADRHFDVGAPRFRWSENSRPTQRATRM